MICWRCGKRGQADPADYRHRGGSGGATWRRARSNVERAITEAQDEGLEAVDAVRAVGENMVDALDQSLKKRPYTTLGLALGAGFLFAATGRR
jgi:ElaB/YqjD/DUF883 family membrane-anchored ribosome-binding protein